MKDTHDERGLAELRALLAEHGPAAVFASIGSVCDETARSTQDDACELWECAAEAARDAASAITDEEEVEAAGDDQGEEAEEDDETPPFERINVAEDEPPVTPLIEARRDEQHAEPAAAPTGDEGRKRTKMAKEDALGPRPPAATHWRCRRIEEEGQKPTLLYHDDGGGISICEWPIRLCTPETIRQRWGAAGGSFVVQFIQTEESGQRRPCGRSRMLMLTPPAASPARDDKSPVEAAPVFAAPLPTLMPSGAASTSDSFAQMFSLLAYMQDRDEKVRSTAREEARLANDRYKADVELMMERDRLASKERIAQIEATARVAGRSITAPGLDAELLAQRIGEVVGEKLEEVYEEDDEQPAPAASPSQMEGIKQLIDMIGPYVPHLAKLFEGNGPPVANPAAPIGAMSGGNDGAE